MKNNENQRFIYIHSTGEKIPVTEKEFQDFYREVSRIRKKEQYHKRCVCPKAFIWSCDGDCDICEHHRSDTLSLDCVNTADGATLYDSDEIEALYSTSDACFENVVEDRLLIEQLFARLRELTPYADQIIEMWLDDYGISDRKIAETLGVPQRTFADLMKRCRAEFRKIRGF